LNLADQQLPGHCKKRMRKPNS